MPKPGYQLMLKTGINTNKLNPKSEYRNPKQIQNSKNYLTTEFTEKHRDKTGLNLPPHSRNIILQSGHPTKINLLVPIIIFRYKTG